MDKEKEYTKDDYNLFWLFAQRNATSANSLLSRPEHISEITWNDAQFAVMAVGSEHRQTLQSFPGPISQMAQQQWELPSVQHKFIEEKINSSKK